MSKVQIRIALVVNSKGEWSCAGWKNGSKQELMDMAIDGLEQGPSEKRYWLAVDVDAPEEDQQITPTVVVARR